MRDIVAAKKTKQCAVRITDVMKDPFYDPKLGAAIGPMKPDKRIRHALTIPGQRAPHICPSMIIGGDEICLERTGQGPTKVALSIP